MEILSVQELVKKYPAFTLGPVSFSLEEGYILGFIGRNGAGKTTTLKSMIGFVHPNAGSVSICGMDFRAQEDACKRAIGVVFGPSRAHFMTNGTKGATARLSGTLRSMNPSESTSFPPECA